MRTRWEYRVVAWNLTATAHAGPGDAWKLDGSLQISRPGVPGAESRRYDGSQATTLGFDLLKRVGADDRELVTNVVERSTVAPAQGYQTAGPPHDHTDQHDNSPPGRSVNPGELSGHQWDSCWPLTGMKPISNPDLTRARIPSVVRI